MFNKSDIGKIFTIKEISEGIPCKKCDFCMRLRLLELGLNFGDKIQVKDHIFGLWRINILSDKGNLVSSIGLRDEELERVCVL